MFTKYPSVTVSGYSCSVGWQSIISTVRHELKKIPKDKKIIVLETYPGVFEEDIIKALKATDRTYSDVVSDALREYLSETILADANKENGGKHGQKKQQGNPAE